MTWTPFERGVNDCCQDDMENAQFSSVGGLDNRDNIHPPDYIKEQDAEAYLKGYTHQAKQLYGDDWETVKFSWGHALTITPKD